MIRRMGGRGDEAGYTGGEIDGGDVALKTAARVVAGVVGGAVVLSAAGVLAAALLSEPRVWFLVLFEVVAAVAGVVAGLVGIGKFRESPAMGLACAAGTLFGSGVLAYFSSAASFAAFDLKLLLIGHGGAAGVLGACAALMALERRSMGPLAAGVVLGGAGAATLAGAWVMRGRIAGLPEGVMYPMAILGFVVVTGLVSAGVHLVIGAFGNGCEGARDAAGGV